LTADATDLAQQAYIHIQQAIVDGTLQAGSVVSEASLARELGISRTPVGKAVRLLAAEGLLEQIPRFGTIVRGIDRRDMLELYELREALESYAAARAARHINADQLRKLHTFCQVGSKLADELRQERGQELSPDQLRRFLAADFAFHTLIVQASGNRRIMQQVRQSRTIARIFETRRQRHSLAIVEQTLRDHEAILDALCRGDAAAAHAAMSHHIETSREEALRQYDLGSHAGDGEADDLMSQLPEDLAAELQRIESEQLG